MKRITLTIDGAKYIAVPVDEYDRMRGAKSNDSPDGVDWARAELGKTLRRAREMVGLSQGELAKKLGGKSQALVSRAESGDMSVGDEYVAAVLKACGLPKDWPASPEQKATKQKRGKRVKAA
jgi:ribosome-binding protein aMBF1 (putative translation factor)